MEQVFQAAVLGAIQGLSEFLPISSSGHLIIFPKLLSWGGVIDSLEFDVALHVGTTIAVVWFFWKDWVRIIGSFLRGLKKGTPTKDFDSKLFLMILAGSVPAGVVGMIFKDLIEENFRQPLLVATTLFIFALVLLFADKMGAKKREFRRLDWKDALLIGLAQAVSLVPGVSRSGITISAGLLKGLDREAATRFSFLLSTPAIAGAAALTAKDSVSTLSGGNFGVFLVGTLVAAVSGWIAIKFLLRFVASHNFNVFVWYRIGLAVLLAAFFWE